MKHRAGGCSIGSLYYMAKMDNPDQYKQMRQNTFNKSIYLLSY